MRKTNQRKECMCQFQEGERVQKPFRKWNDEEWAEEMYSDVYQPASRNRDLENDCLSGWEAAFMDGYESAS